VRDTKQDGLSASLEVSKDGLESLTEIAQQTRRDLVTMIRSAKSRHLRSSSLSEMRCVERSAMEIHGLTSHRSADAEGSHEAEGRPGAVSGREIT
jgi:hypothetical protein